jgi:putative NADPH-quinone reductase
MTKPERARVLGIVGSPRQGGNTDILVDEILSGAREAGAQVEKIMLGELAIAPCQACYACRKNGKCVQRDDMEDLLTKMKSSSVWVLGTPVYWWGPSAQLKVFVDRWFSKASGPACKETFEDRRVILAVPMGDTDPATGRHVVGMFTDALEFVKAKLFASILAPGAYEAGDVAKSREILEQARRAGRDAVST